MKAKRSRALADSLTGIAAHSPARALGPESRYLIVGDLRLGDGGSRDRLARERALVYDVLGRHYFDRGYTLVLDGDIEDLRRYWLKDILAAWPELYALFDAYHEDGRLLKILGDHDLSLLRIRSYPYELAHGFRLDGAERSILIVHGHQAAQPYLEYDYLEDYLPRWQSSALRRADSGTDEGARARFKIERRLYRAAAQAGLVAVASHTRRPLFESTTNRDSIRDDIDRLLGRQSLSEEEARLVKLIKVYGLRPRASKAYPSGLAYKRELPLLPCLFSPGRFLSGRRDASSELRMLEIEGDRIGMVRWSEQPSPDPVLLGGRSYLRSETRMASIADILARSGAGALESDYEAEGPDTEDGSGGAA